MIDDLELRDLFKAESEEHLQSLDTGLLHLEKKPDDQPVLDEVFRAMHSLKGAARMLDIGDIETLAHRCEDILRAGKSGDKPLTPEMIATLFPPLDALRKLVQEAIAGEKADVDIEAVMSGIGVTPAKKAATKSTPRKAKARATPARKPRSKAREEKPQAIEPEAEEAPGQQAAATAPTRQQFHIDTIRVGTDKLDKLMNQAGELTVSKGRMTRRLHDIQAIVDLWEDWYKGQSVIRASQTIPGGRQDRRRTNSPQALQHERIECLGELISHLRQAVYEDVTRLEFVIDQITNDIRNTRLLPLSTIFSLFPRLVRDLSASQSKKIELIVQGGDTQADKHIIEKMKDPLMHVLRNAIDHGMESSAERKKAGKPASGTIRLRASQTATSICIEVSDDGRGLNLEKIRELALKRKLKRQEELDAMSDDQIQSLIFVSGFSTSTFISDVSGRGVGLDVVRANVEALKGSIEVQSEAGKGCCIRMNLPITLASTRVLITVVDGRSYALPSESILASRYIKTDEIFQIEGRDTINHQNQPLHVASLSDLLEVGPAESGDLEQQDPFQHEQLQQKRPCVIIGSGTGHCGLLVDALLDERPVVVKPIGGLLKRVRNVSNVTILDTGEVCMILSPHDLVRSVEKMGASMPANEPSESESRKTSILLVEDSITTRIQEKHILEGAGYQVIEAVDGVDALDKLAQQKADAVVTDVVMPNMDGLQLTEEIRRSHTFKNLPVILVTTLATDEDRKKGLEAGANAYIMKPRFDQKVLLETLKRLI